MPSSVAQSGSPQSDSVQIPDTLLSDVHFTKLETVQPYLEQGSIPIPPPAGIVSALNGYIQNRHLFVKDDEEFGSLTDAATRLLEEVKGSNRVRNQDLVDMVGNKLEGRFKKFDEIFKKFDERFNKIDERFYKTDERFKKFDERFNKIDERFNKTDERFKKFDERFNKFEETFEKKWDTREKTLDTKLGDIQKSLERLENELNGIGWKQLIGYGCLPSILLTYH
nr:uncharacterized protein I203_07850 [Kwoniella mangroviensis CBS 8507]OCF63114.1 hypothetical protein I203_07850 [Kwoniella mangroviensis CBS 8507]